MVKTYTTIVIIFLLVIAAVIYAYITTGGPVDARAVRFDTTRESNISSLQYPIEQYFEQHNMLPQKLEDVNSNGVPIVDPETKKPYKLEITNATNYKICATFSTAYDSKNPNMRKSGYSYYNINHPKGYYCVPFVIPSYFIKPSPIPTLGPAYNYSPATFTVSKSIQDEKIESVSTNATNLKYSNFPYGFFSSNQNDWGLINYASISVTVDIVFKNPTKLKAVTNLFTNCPYPNCYTWDYKTYNNKGTVIEEVNGVGASSEADSTVFLTKSDEISKLHMTAYRTKGPQDFYIHWKKIKLTYS